MSIQTRLWLVVTALLAAVLAGNAVVVLGVETRQIRSGFERESLSFANLAAPQVLRAYGESNRETDDPVLNQRLSELAAGLPSLSSMALLSPRGTVLARYPKDAGIPPFEPLRLTSPDSKSNYIDEDTGRALELVVPLSARPSSPPVFLRITVRENPVIERIRTLRFAFGTSLVVLLVLGALIAFRVAAVIVKPVKKLTAAAISIRDGDLASRVTDYGTGEIAELSASFNDMAQKLQTQTDQLEERNEDLQNAYNELQALQNELMALERMAAVGRTASAISHEIDNPIGVILGTAEMLCEQLEDSPDLLEDAQLIEQECKRCRRIVRDLLNLSRPAESDDGPVDLRPTTEGILRGLKHHPAFKGIELRTNWPELIPPLSIDTDGLKQVLLNLLLNAANSMGGSGVAGIDVHIEDDWVAIEIWDEGPGIEGGNLDKIFEPYFTTSKGTGKGTGLGLAVSRRIVERSGGSISAENRAQGGSVFRVRLPTG